MKTMSLLNIAVMCAMLCVCQASFYNVFGLGSQPRCPSAVKPCRLKVEMTSPMGDQTTESHSCSCPDSKPCLTDWTRRDHVITRELRTASRISMTLSMLFCDTIQPQRQCRADEVALQVSGLTLVPTEVNFVNCACSDGLPLVLHEQYHGSDHKLYMSYVCASFKDQCSRGWGYRRNCMEFDNESGRITYPCKCSSNRSCRPTSYNAPYRCLRD